MKTLMHPPFVRVCTFLMIISFFSAFSLHVTACSLFPRLLHHINVGKTRCSLSTAYGEITPQQNMKELISISAGPDDKDCESLTLTDDELEFLKEVILKYQNIDFGLASGNFEKQTATEYDSILAKNKSSADDKCSCRIYKHIERRGDWTFYIDTKKAACSLDTTCAMIPPEGCGDTAVDRFDGSPDRNWFALKILLPSIVGLAIMFVLFYLYYKRKTQV